MRGLMLALLVCAGALTPVGVSAQLTAGPVELVTDASNFSEGPLWLPEGKWIYSDVTKNQIVYEDGAPYRQPSNGSNGLTLDRQGRLIACESMKKRITRTEADGTITVLAESFDGKPLNTTNDVIVRGDGTVYFTDPTGPRKPKGGLGYSGVFGIRPDGSMVQVSNDLKYPNGIALSPDDKILYVADYLGGVIRAYDLAADGTASNARDLCQVKNPDGFAADAAGRLWIASAKDVQIHGPDGSHLGTVVVPMGTPTNCAFGGTDGRTLLITARRTVYRVAVSEPGLAEALQVAK